MNIERKNETQFWLISEESGLVAARGTTFVGIAKVGDVARYSKVVHREIAASSWLALHPDENNIVRTTPSACCL